MNRPARKKQVKAPKTVTLTIDKKYADAVKRVIKKLDQESEPPKPIKRVEKLSPEKLKAGMAVMKECAAFVKVLQDEFDRLSEDYDTPDLMLKDDAKWWDKYSNALAKCMEYGLDNLAIYY